MSAASRQVVVIVGAGPGMGLSLARVFAKQGHPVALLARTQSSLDALATQVNQETGSPSKGYAVSASDAEGLSKVFESIKKELGPPVIGIHNPAGGFGFGPFRQMKVEQLDEAYSVQVKGGFLLAQEILKSIETLPDFSSKEHNSNPLGAIFFTGATASIKGSAKFSTFSSAKFGLRALSQSLAREYHPQGVHVAHFIVDGAIESEKARQFLGPEPHPDARLNSDGIAENYYHVWQQKRGAWTQELDVRTAFEKF